MMTGVLICQVPTHLSARSPQSPLLLFPFHQSWKCLQQKSLDHLPNKRCEILILSSSGSRYRYCWFYNSRLDDYQISQLRSSLSSLVSSSKPPASFLAQTRRQNPPKSKLQITPLDHPPFPTIQWTWNFPFQRQLHPSLSNVGQWLLHCRMTSCTLGRTLKRKYPAYFIRSVLNICNLSSENFEIHFPHFSQN